MKQALYRKYRPRTFEEVQGQSNIVNILKNQIINDKISHAYIFSGTRGTGKTSTAKIFAKAVNCLTPINGSPCNFCENCLAVSEETTMDIVEMDAASNRRIDDIRQIREQVIYPPSNLKYKVYIIDEAHMITNEGFNALLKIMEEPPKHLIFILATTELDKIPDTILSRTQRFEFKSLSTDEIKNQILQVSKLENVQISDRAAEIISNVASGAMRDALSVLDQVFSIGKTNIEPSDVYDLLGIFSDEIKSEYAKKIFSNDSKGLISLIEEQLSKGKNSINFIKEISTFFKELMYIKIGVKDDFTNGLVENVSLERLINSIDILLEYEELMKKSDSADLLFNVGSLRLLDYMPRKVLESKIITLEERLDNLEKNGTSKVFAENNPKLIEKSYDNGNVDLDSVNSLFEEFEEKSKDVNQDENYGDREPLENLNENLEKDTKDLESNFDKEKDSESHAQLLLEILRTKYVHTRPLLEEIKKIEQQTSTIVIYLEEKMMSYTFSMKYFFNQAEIDLKEKTNISYNIKFEKYEEKPQNIKFDESKLEDLQNLFGGKINIKD